MSDAPSGQAGMMIVPAARYPRLVSTLLGDVPTVHTVAILTAVRGDSDSDHQPGEASQNIRRNADLGRDLATYSLRQTKGRFGPLENPYVVTNLPRPWLVAVGVKYGQDAVIFGYRKGGQELGMGFERICTNAARGTVGHAVATRAMWLNPRALDGGRACSDNEDVHREFSVRYRGVPFEIPFFDEDPAHEEDFRGGKMLTYQSADLPVHAKPALDTYLTAQTQLDETLRAGDHTGHFLYLRHGILANARVALFQAMGDWRPFPLRWERQW